MSTIYVTWNPNKICNILPSDCPHSAETVEALVMAEEYSGSNYSTNIAGHEALSAAELIVCNEFDGELASAPLHDYEDAQRVTISRGLLQALVQTAQRTTDLEGVYCTSGRRFYSWERVQEEVNANGNR